MAFLILLLTIPGCILFFYVHMGTARLLVLRASCKILRTWKTASGTVVSTDRPGPAIFRNPWTVIYEFTDDHGEKHIGKAVFPKTCPYSSNAPVQVLYNPKNPALCRLEAQLRSGQLLERDEFRLKSPMRLRIELIVNMVLCLLFAAGAVVLDLKWSYTKGAGVLGYLFLAAVFLGCGALEVHALFPGKLQ